MISYIITSYKEPKTIGRAIESILSQATGKYEILVVAPDKETLNEAKKYTLANKKVKILQDSGQGKSSALNFAVSKSKGEILVLTDGDVYIGNNSISPLIEFFKEKNVGAVSGRPISTNTKENKYGYWAYLLTQIAHERRIKAELDKKRFFCSGYLFAIRKDLFPKLPNDLLSEDGYISHYVYTKGYTIRYSKESLVFVKYPDNFSDWIKQKKRSAGGYNQIRKMVGVEMRSFKTEGKGAFGFLRYLSSLKQFYWLFQLFFARIYLWYVIYRDINLKKKSQKEIWQRVESTK